MATVEQDLTYPLLQDKVQFLQAEEPEVPFVVDPKEYTLFEGAVPQPDAAVA